MMGKKFTGAAYYYMTTWYHMKQYCKEQYPDGSPFSKSTILFYDHCATAYTNNRGNYERTDTEASFENASWTV